MTEESNVQELKNIIKLVFEIVNPIVREIRKDGFQATDLFAFLSDEEFKKLIEPTISGLKDIPSEFKGFKIANGFELAGVVLDETKDLFEAIFPAK